MIKRTERFQLRNDQQEAGTFNIQKALQLMNQGDRLSQKQNNMALSTCFVSKELYLKLRNTLTVKLELPNFLSELTVEMTESNPALDTRIYLMDQFTQNYKQIYTEEYIVFLNEIILSCMKQMIRISLPSLLNSQSLVLVKNELNLNNFIDFMVKFVDETETQGIIMTGESGRIILKAKLINDYLRAISVIFHFQQTQHFRQNAEYHMLIKTT